VTDHDRMLLTPTYYVFRMYVPFQDAMLLPVSMQAGQYDRHGVVLPRLDALAARTQEGKLWLALTNVDARRHAVVQIVGAGVHRVNGETLGAPNFDSINTFANPRNVYPTHLSAATIGGKLLVELPPHSVSVVTVQ
jgi:alpha-L-arabinofuranosidase